MASITPDNNALNDRQSNASEESDVKSLGEIWFHLTDGGTSALGSSSVGSTSPARAASSNMVANSGKLTASSLLTLASAISAKTSTKMALPGLFPSGSRFRQETRQQLPKVDLRMRDAERPSLATSIAPGKKRKRGLTEERRRERNSREQARSNRLSVQFAELRTILVQAGVVVPKGTKGCVLGIVMDYIRSLEHGKQRADLECHQLRQQVASMSAGNHQGPQFIQTVAVQNGMSSLLQEDSPGSTDANQDSSKATSLTESQYKATFEHCIAGMAIATLGGSFVHGNRLFCQLTNHTPEDLEKLSIFNLTAQDQLTFAFERLSQLLSDGTSPASSIELRAAAPGLGMHIALLPDCDLSKIPGDCRRNRLLITLIQRNSPSSSCAQLLLPMPSSSDATKEMTLSSNSGGAGASPTTDTTVKAPMIMDSPSPFFATG